MKLRHFIYAALMRGEIAFNWPVESFGLVGTTRMTDTGQRDASINEGRKKLIVVDDDEALVELLQAVLNQEGYQTIGCIRNHEALECIRTEQPDLVILDLKYPRPPDGLEIVNEIRSDHALAELPLIICSAAIPWLHDLRDQLNSLGCVMVEKPFDLSTIIDSVHRMIKRKGDGKKWCS